jgi:hypothetical protein
MSSWSYRKRASHRSLAWSQGLGFGVCGLGIGSEDAWSQGLGFGVCGLGIGSEDAWSQGLGFWGLWFRNRE